MDGPIGILREPGEDFAVVKVGAERARDGLIGVVGDEDVGIGDSGVHILKEIGEEVPVDEDRVSPFYRRRDKGAHEFIKGEIGFCAKVSPET